MFASQIVRSRTLSLLALIGMLTLAGALVPHSATAQNLIDNPSAETKAPDNNNIGTSDDIADWTETTGVFSRPGGDLNDWLPFSDGSIGSTDGNNVFVLSTSNPDTGSEFNLQQDITGVSVSGGITYDFSGDIKTFSPDEARIIVEYRDGSGTVLDSYDSGYQGTGGSFVTLTDSRTAPAGTNLVRVRLVARENGGSNNFNDAFFDNLSLTAQSAPLTADDDGPFVTETPDDLSVAAPGLLGNDALGDPSGDIASFGGGDLGGSVTSNAAGSSVSLAGGTLTVNADGSLLLSTPTDIGTYTFNYRLSNGSEQSDGTVTLEVTRNNLIANPSAENVEGSNDSITDWTEDPTTLSNGQANTWIGFDEDGVTAGLRSFAPEPVNPDNGSTFNLQQDVTGGPVTGGTTFEFSADAKSIGSDDVRVILEYRDGGGNVLDSYDSGFLSTGGATTQLTDTRTAPSGTALIRVRLQGRENGGTDNGLDFADAFVDNLRLFASAAPLNAANDGPFATPANSTLSRTAPGLLLNDSRGTPEGTLASFGGGDLGGSVTSNAAGSTVTLAGGTLTVNADGSFTLDTPTVQGTYTFDYRLSNGSEQSDATATIEVQPATGDNLLLNPSAENTTSEDDSGNANDVASWTEQPGQLATGTTNDWLSFDESGATDGANAFTTEPVFPDANSEFNLQQDVTGSEVQGGRAYAFAGDMKSTGPDDVRMVVEYRDGGTILDSYDTGYQDTGGTFTTVSDTRTAPAGTDAIRVRLLVREEGGTTNFAEGVFDNLSLTVSNTPIQFQASGPASLTVDEDAGPTSLNGTLSADDPDDDQTIAWSVASGPSNGTLDGLPTTASAGGSGITPTGVTYTPNADFSGTDAFTIRVSDGTAEDLLNFDVTVNPVNDAPTITTLPDQTTDEDVTLSGIGFTVGDAETAAGNLTVSFSADTPSLIESHTFGGSGADRTLSITPADNQNGVLNVTVTVTDESGRTASDVFQLTINAVNDLPAVSPAISTFDVTVQEDDPVPAISFTVSDVESGGAGVSVTASSDNQTLVPDADLSVTNNGGGDRTLDVTPAANESGTATITVTLDDGTDTVDDNFTLTVNPANDAPTITAIGNRTIDEDTNTGAIGFTVGDVETTDLTTLTLAATSSDQTLVPDANIALTGPDASGAATVTVTPAPDENGGPATITVTADDGGRSADETFDVTVTPTNDAPSISGDLGIATNEGTAVTLTSTDLEANDPDDGAADLTYTVTSTPSNGAIQVGGSPASFTEQQLNDGTVAYVHDGSETTSDAFDVELADGGEDGAGTATATINVDVNAQNDAPTISSIADQTIEEDATLSSLSFTVDDTETSDLSTLSLSGSSGNTTLVPNSNISFTGPDNSGNASITVNPAPNESGTATITVTVDDGAGSNNTATEDFVLTVNAVPDLSITDGGSGNLDFSGSVSPGTDDNPVGLFALSAGQSGASFDGVTVTNKDPGVAGISAARLYWSSDQTLEPGSDTQLDEVTSLDASSAPSTISFSGFSQSIPTSARYAILAIDVQGGASGDVRFELAQDSDLSVSGGEIATVNGTSESSFSALPLSNGTTALPVELARFDATTSETEGITLQWQTASETRNAGFDIQRVKASRRDASTGSDVWQTVGSVKGAGTTTEAQSYRFEDADIPYDADSLTYRLKQVDTDGSTSYSEPITVARNAVQQVQLLGTYPNPARSRATVRFALPDPGSGSRTGSKPTQVTLRLYDALGRQVRTVQADAEAGRHTLQLEIGSLSSGVYFLRLQAGSTVKTQRLTVVK